MDLVETESDSDEDKLSMGSSFKTEGTYSL